ncbi:hypothetical protein HDU86_004214 [Geranomyces michiganensis]|nr:hypothetical protein HDU86_004214 [Geranomyces michiganensis]
MTGGVCVTTVGSVGENGDGATVAVSVVENGLSVADVLRGSEVASELNSEKLCTDGRVGDGSGDDKNVSVVGTSKVSVGVDSSVRVLNGTSSVVGTVGVAPLFWPGASMERVVGVADMSGAMTVDVGTAAVAVRLSKDCEATEIAGVGADVGEGIAGDATLTATVAVAEAGEDSVKAGDETGSTDVPACKLVNKEVGNLVCVAVRDVAVENLPVGSAAVLVNKRDVLAAVEVRRIVADGVDFVRVDRRLLRDLVRVAVVGFGVLLDVRLPVVVVAEAVRAAPGLGLGGVVGEDVDCDRETLLLVADGAGLASKVEKMTGSVAGVGNDVGGKSSGTEVVAVGNSGSVAVWLTWDVAVCSLATSVEKARVSPLEKPGCAESVEIACNVGIGAEVATLDVAGNNKVSTTDCDDAKFTMDDALPMSSVDTVTEDSLAVVSSGNDAVEVV